MSESSRDKILKRLKNTTRDEPQNSSSGFHFLKHYNEPLLQIFQHKLETVNGVFIYSEDISNFQNQLKTYIDEQQLSKICCMEASIQQKLGIPYSEMLSKETQVAITGCEYLIAQTGSAVLSTAQTGSRRTFSYAPVHIIVAFKNQLFGQLEEGLNLLAEKYKNKLPSQITTITGPSRTADIEKTLVLGAHGPKELIIFYIDVNLE